MKNVSAAWLAQFEENKMHSQKTTHIVNEAFAMFGDVMEKIVSNRDKLLLFVQGIRDGYCELLRRTSFSLNRGRSNNPSQKLEMSEFGTDPCWSRIPSLYNSDKTAFRDGNPTSLFLIVE